MKSLSRLSRIRLKKFIWLVIVTTALGTSGEIFELGEASGSLVSEMGEQAFLWFFGGIIFWGFEILYFPSSKAAFFRRLNFISLIVVKSLLLIGLFACLWILGDILFPEIETDEPLPFSEVFLEFLGVFLVVLFLQLIIQTARIIGPERYFSFVLGRYRQPVKENRVFLFIDIQGSTVLAREMGDIGVQNLITRVFLDMDKPISELGGEINRYIGDQIVITWPVEKLRTKSDPITCCFAIREKMRTLEPDYLRQFGHAPKFWMALHQGPVVISECGEQRRELSFFGDTINTAARIEHACKAMNAEVLASEIVVANLGVPPGIKKIKLEPLQLRGHDEPTMLYSLTEAKSD